VGLQGRGLPDCRPLLSQDGTLAPRGRATRLENHDRIHGTPRGWPQLALLHVSEELLHIVLPLGEVWITPGWGKRNMPRSIANTSFWVRGGPVGPEAVVEGTATPRPLHEPSITRSWLGQDA
jgi:hypothetical protein